jgi:hypothetical protein
MCQCNWIHDHTFGGLIIGFFMDDFDLFEILLKKCRPHVRVYVEEAIACYKAGVFRACIIVTWHALFFDFIYKLEELELVGDKNALQILDKFKKISKDIRKENIREINQFESTIIDSMYENFELITYLEKIDLERILLDRHRCAHPSMHSLDEAYSPTAELAKTHLRNCVEIMLEREPVQGNSALEFYFNRIKSKYFPIEKNEAKKYLQDYLKRPKSTLLKNLIISLIKAYLNEISADEVELKRIRGALEAIIDIYPEESNLVIGSKFSEIANAISDRFLYRVLILVVKIPFFFQSSNNSILTKLNRLVESISSQDENLFVVISHASSLEFFSEKVSKWIKHAECDQMIKLVSLNPNGKLIKRAIEIFQNVASFASANLVENKIMLPLISYFSVSDIRLIISLVKKNNQIHYANSTSQFLNILLECSHACEDELIQDWIILYEFLKNQNLSDMYQDVLNKIKEIVIFV